MALAPGVQLGRYQIAGAIGSGGMGMVYKARDTRLDRTVALKVLSDHLAATPERRERFEREARAISQLNHPHICTLHDVGTEDGVDFFVMEYLEGETLAERLRKGALAREKALELAVQIADGLTEAHRAGIVHRDLKPANVMLTKSGVKLLDFGLAKLVKAQPVSGESDALTEERTLVGTLRYMAPEQLEGKTIDARADLWAFGVVLYEMLTGRSAFEGASPASLISAILKDEPPPLREIQPLSPHSLERLVQKCLRKDPEERWQTARDLKDELVWIGAGEESAPKRSRWMPLVATAAGSLLLAALLLWSAFPRDPKEPPGVKRLVIDLPKGQSLARSGGTGIAVSPDGESVVYPVVLDDGQTRLHWRSIARFEATPLGGTEGAVNPFFSPDGGWVAFYAGGALKKVRLAEGASSASICAASDVYGASWEPDGTIWLTTALSTLHRVPSSGGKLEPVHYSGPLTIINLGGGLPGGKALLVFGTEGDDETPVTGVLTLDSLETKVLLEGGLFPRYAASGHVLFELGGTLMAAAFDPVRLELRGPAFPVLQDLSAGFVGDRSRFDLSKEGTLVYEPSPRETGEDFPLHWVDRAGGATLAVATPETLESPRVSPDGRQIALERGMDIWAVSLTRDTWTRLTFGGSERYSPVWSHDGSRLFFTSGQQMSWRWVDGSGTDEPLIEGLEVVPTSASSDGKTLVFSRLSERGDWDVGALSLEEEGEARNVLETRFNESFAVLSPDDRLLAYVSDESGRNEVHVVPFRDEGRRVAVSTNGGTEPRWSPDGRELYYREEDQIMAVSISTGPGLELGKASPLFQGRYRRGIRSAQYDVTAEGRFLMAGEIPVTGIHVVLNWHEELKRLAPAP